MKQHVVAVILIILCIFLVVQNNNLKKDNKQLGITLDDVEQTVIDLMGENEELLVREDKMSDSLSSGNEENNGNNINEVIESAVNDFLEAFYDYDSQTNVKEQVQPHVTDSFLSKVKFQEVTETTVKYYSDFIKSEVYYSDKINNVFVRVWNEITIQGQSSEKQTFLQLKLVEVNGIYLVDDMGIQGNLDAEGYLDS